MSIPNHRPRESLVQYEAPIEVGQDTHQRQKVNLTGTAGKKKGQLQPLETKPTTDDILHAILPPREWLEENKHYIQYVSNQKPSRTDVINLQQMLDQRLMERQARESGICPIREELHSQCFDEIIRQVTIDCPERGLLLMRVRDEIKMTIAAYQTLYQSSVTFGSRKQLQAEHGKADLIKRIEELGERKIRLENKVSSEISRSFPTLVLSRILGARAEEQMRCH